MINKRKNSFIVSVCLLSMAGVSVWAISEQGDLTVVEKRLNQLPMRIDVFKGEELSFDQAVHQELNEDISIVRRYTSFVEGRKWLWLYVGYYGTRQGGRTRHMPDACYPGAGWAIMDLRDTNVFYGNNGEKNACVNQMQIRKGDEERLVLYWIQSSDHKVMHTGMQQNIHRLLNRLTRRRDDGAFVRISVPIFDNDLLEATQLLHEFARQLLNILPNYWPIERRL